MRHAKTQRTKLPKLPHIKIYTTPDLVEAFALFSRGQGRSSSRQGEFLIKQALMGAQPEKRHATG